MRNPPSRGLLVAVVGAVLIAAVAAPVAGDALASPSSPSIDPRADSVEPGADSIEPAIAAQSSPPVEQIDNEYDPDATTQIRIEPSSNRDARWVVSVRYGLTDANQTAAFEALGDRFLDGEVGPDPSLFEGFAREANRNVDRTMRIEDVDREVVVHDDPSSYDVAGDEATAVGELRLTFVWTSFLAQDGENLVLGDALTTPNDGTWLLSLEQGQTLEVATPEGYTVTGTPGATVPLQNNAVIIEGPRTFGEEERVAVVYAPAGTVGPPWTMLAAAIVLAALLIAGSIVGYRRMDGTGSIAGNDRTNGGGDSDPGTTESVAGAAGATGTGGGAGNGDDIHRESDGDDETGVEGGAASATEAETERDDEADLSLLSDEERVERLLGDKGGRMRQADIVAETGWSDAKVSQLLSAMADEGRVEKLRLGRENLISLPDDEDETGGSGGSGSGSERDDGSANGTDDGPDRAGDGR
ncbi:helix-turn-helix transcriptional regulator [Halorubrum trueperi]|uniref:Helix-turn-helix transcriptional regulator n=1 Tax=Halorubrum trueperi TaxID=2004704 RepID=A0ABD5UEU7_9EURY